MPSLYFSPVTITKKAIFVSHFWLHSFRQTNADFGAEFMVLASIAVDLPRHSTKQINDFVNKFLETFQIKFNEYPKLLSIIANYVFITSSRYILLHHIVP